MFVCTSSAHSRVAERALHLWLGPARFFAFAFFLHYLYLCSMACSFKKIFFIFLVVVIVIVVVAFAVFAIVDFCHFLCLPLAWSCQVTI